MLLRYPPLVSAVCGAQLRWWRRGNNVACKPPRLLVGFNPYPEVFGRLPLGFFPADCSPRPRSPQSTAAFPVSPALSGRVPLRCISGFNAANWISPLRGCRLSRWHPLVGI